MEVSSSLLFWQITLSEMAVGSLFRWDEISGFYTHLVVAQAEGSTAVSVICWDLDPCKWKKFLLWATPLKKLKSFPPAAQTMPSLSWGHRVMDFSQSILLKMHRQALLEKHSSIWTETKGHFLHLLSKGLLRSLMTNNIPRFTLNHCNLRFFINISFLA